MYTHDESEDGPLPDGAAGAVTDRAALDVTSLRAAVVGGPDAPYSVVDLVDHTGSTNAELLGRAGTSADRTVLLAEHQSSGRGRLGRSWTAPPRSQLIVSVLLRPGPVAPVLLGWLPLVTGVAVRDALVGTAGVDATLKWPNDVLVGGRKIAGILVEATTVTGGGDFSVRLPALVVGIGLNVSLTADELPVPHATSIALEGGCVDRDALAQALLRALADRHGRWRDRSAVSGATVPADLAADYRAACSTLGGPVRAELPGGEVLVGTADDVDTEGRLVVVTADGARRTVAAGDVSHLRRPDGGLD